MSIARLNKVTRARKPSKCGKCGKDILPGSPYVWWKFRYSGRYVRCMDHMPESWERESNSKRQALMQAEDAFSNAQDATNPESAAGFLLEARDYAQSALDDFQSALDGWQGTNLENSELYSTFEEAVSELEIWINTIEQASTEVEGLEEPDENDYEDAEGFTDEAAYETDHVQFEVEMSSILDNLPDVPSVDF